VALLLTILRRPVDGDRVGRERTVRLFLIGLAAQCMHFMEEFVTRFQDRFPTLLGLLAWSENFFVVFNLNMAERLDPSGDWPAKRVPARSIPCVVLRDWSDHEWNRTSHARGRSSGIFPGLDHFTSRWSIGCVALARAASVDHIFGIEC